MKNCKRNKICDEQIKEINKRSQLEHKSVKLQELRAELHLTEERIRQRKRKVEYLSHLHFTGHHTGKHVCYAEDLQRGAGPFTPADF